MVSRNRILTNHNESYISFVTSNHQTTNLVFPNFSQPWAVEKLCIGPKQFFFSILDQWKIYLLFILLKLRKNCEKNWGKQGSWFGGLMSRTWYFLFIFFYFKTSYQLIKKFVKIRNYGIRFLIFKSVDFPLE